MPRPDRSTSPAELAANALRRLDAVPARAGGWVPGTPTPTPQPLPDLSLEAWASSLAASPSEDPDAAESAGGTRAPGAHRPGPRGRVGVPFVRAAAPLVPATLRGGRTGLSARAVLALAVVLLVAVGFAALPSLRSDGAAGVEAPRRVEGAADLSPPGQSGAEPAVASGTTASPGGPAQTTNSPGGPGPGPAATGAAGTAAPTVAQVLVHVVGRVARPGVVTLPGGSRVADALAAVGGATPEADLAAVNLARLLVDGEQVRVPAPGEVLAPLPPGSTGTGAGDGGAAAGSADEVLDLNTATESELDGLPGVGPVLAARIVAWRTTNGGYRSVEELQEVSGIGERTYAEIAPRVRV